jgi:hypothetical protein
MTHPLDFRLYLSGPCQRKVRGALIKSESMMSQDKSGKRNITRFGYAIAVVVNLVLLFIVNCLLAWGWIPFLTDDFEQLLPILNLSLVVGAGANFAFIFYSASWFRSVGQIVQSIISLFVIVDTLKVFPFDFSPYNVDWAMITRGALIVGGVAVSIGLIAESVKLIRALVPGDSRHPIPE